MVQKKYLLSILVLFIGYSLFSQSSHKNDNNCERNRWYWQMPNRVINEIGVKKDMVVADVGAGDGYFSIPLAICVGENGKVYSSDIDKKALNILKQKSKDKNLSNIHVIIGKEMDPLLPKNESDFILIVNTIHYIEDFKGFIINTGKGLKPNGKVAIIQWDAEKMQKEKPYLTLEKFKMSTTLNKIYSSNLQVDRILTFLPAQNIYVCSIREGK